MEQQSLDSDINTLGFLGGDVIHHRDEFHKQHAELLECYGALCEYSHELKTQLKITNSDGVKLLTAGLYARAMSMYEGVLILGERGMVAEATLLLRGIYELLFTMKAMAEDSNFSQKLFASAIKKRISQLENLKEAAPSLEKKRQVDAQIVLFQKKLKIGDKKLFIRDIAEAANLLTSYLVEYNHFCSSAHASIGSLVSQYLPSDKNERINAVVWGPDFKEIPVLLTVSMNTFIQFIEAAAKVLQFENQQVCESWKKRIFEVGGGYVKEKIEA